MKTACIVYATREGQTRKIAQYLAGALREESFDQVDIRDAQSSAEDIKIGRYSAMIIAASVHGGRHEPEIVDFVKLHRYELDKLHTAFLSVSLSEAGAERANATPEQHARFTADVEQMLSNFFRQTGWIPDAVMPVAGALVYSKYNVFIRFVMKRIARKAGGDTDTSRDYEYTDWLSLKRFASQFGRMPLRSNGGDEQIENQHATEAVEVK